MSVIASTGGTSGGQVGITLTVRAPNSAPPSASHPGTPGSPSTTHLPFTGAPLAAEIDLGLIAIVVGVALVTAAKRVAARR